MFVTTIEFVVDIKRKDLEEKLKAYDNFDEYDMEDLDKKDIRKGVFAIFKNPIDLRYLEEELIKNIGIVELEKQPIDD
jgi:hypothetical protein